MVKEKWIINILDKVAGQYNRGVDQIGNPSYYFAIDRWNLNCNRRTVLDTRSSHRGKRSKTDSEYFDVIEPNKVTTKGQGTIYFND